MRSVQPAVYAGRRRPGQCSAQALFYSPSHRSLASTTSYSGWFFFHDGSPQLDRLVLFFVSSFWNGLVPIYLDKQVWVVLDAAAAVALTVMALRLTTKQKEAEETLIARRWHIASLIVFGSLFAIWATQLGPSDDEDRFCNVVVDSRSTYCD